jgi:ATP-binding cassette subfamily F protein 3
MLAITNLTYYIGSRIIYDDSSIHIKSRDKIGLVGLNGTGKSTLLKIIAGNIKPETGTIGIDKGCSIGFLNQDLLSYQTDASIRSVAMQAFEDVIAVQQEIDEVLSEMEKEYSDELLTRLTTLQDRFGEKGGYEMEAKTEAVLEGMGFTTKDLEKPLSQFSGGWRMRVMLSKLLLQNHSLLMLDEPTNHLDLVSIQWVENYLKNYNSALIVVSHDRAFLDQVTNKTVEVSNHQLNPYAGNYSFYEVEKAKRAELQDKAYANQQQQIKQTEQFIDRFRSKASKATQVQSRIKALDRLERVEHSAGSSANVKFKFPLAQQPGRMIVSMKNINKSFGDICILKNASGQIERGDKIALIGANGKGKSTLMRVIADKGVSSEGGTVELGHNVVMSFYAQHQLDSLHADNTILQELQIVGANRPESDLRRIAGMFLFTKDDVHKKVGVLSGGEKSRVALAKVLLNEANFLLLDEPTNHLDMVSVNILAQALQQYEGTFILVSHDRHFISMVANKIWYIEDHQIKEYPGTYEEYNYYIKNIK